MSIGNLSSVGKKENTNSNKIYRVGVTLSFTVDNTTFETSFYFYSSVDISNVTTLKNYINTKGTIYGNCTPGCATDYVTAPSTKGYFVTSLKYNQPSDVLTVRCQNIGTGRYSDEFVTSITVWSSAEI